MIAPWTLVMFALVNGVFSADLKFHSIPMNNDLACLAAAKTLADKSSGIAFACINSNTGDVIQVKK